MDNMKMTDHTTTNWTTFLGFDVGKDTIAIFDSASGQHHILENRAAPLRRFLKTCDPQSYAVCEATGGYEGCLLDCLLACNITCHRADARKVKSFIRSFGTLAKTDAIDARALADYGRERHARLAVWQARSTAQVELQTLAHHRVDLVKLRAAEKCRLQAPQAKIIRPFCRKLIAHLDKQIATIEREINRRIASDERLARTVECLLAMPGVGQITAHTLCAFLPELGTLTRRQVAALAGLAPHPRDSGKMHGYRRTHGGRPQIRTALFMAAMSARQHDQQMRAFYQRLIKNGKKPIVAITAIMRKMIVILNARMRDMEMLHQS